MALGPTQHFQLITGKYQGPYFSEKLHALDVISTATISTCPVLCDPAYAEENAKARVKALNGRVIPTIGIVAQTLSSDWLVEIEVVAAA